MRIKVSVQKSLSNITFTDNDIGKTRLTIDNHIHACDKLTFTFTW